MSFVFFLEGTNVNLSEIIFHQNVRLGNENHLLYTSKKKRYCLNKMHDRPPPLDHSFSHSG